MRTGTLSVGSDLARKNLQQLKVIEDRDGNVPTKEENERGRKVEDLENVEKEIVEISRN